MSKMPWYIKSDGIRYEESKMVFYFHFHWAYIHWIKMKVLAEILWNWIFKRNK